MSDQLRISDSGEIETWDGEPLFSPATVQDATAAGVRLFEPSAFEQLRGQLAIDDQQVGER